ncbi:hypothetical protein BKA57DRAFT_283459 [Linnemannia elongata]|nr:hypothetical protein BKA57DRAFT_283459 [Linnemannia elongata]
MTTNHLVFFLLCLLKYHSLPPNNPSIAHLCSVSSVLLINASALVLCAPFSFAHLPSRNFNLFTRFMLHLSPLFCMVNLLHALCMCGNHLSSYSSSSLYCIHEHTSHILYRLTDPFFLPPQSQTHQRSLFYLYPHAHSPVLGSFLFGSFFSFRPWLLFSLHVALTSTPFNFIPLTLHLRVLTTN